MRRLRCLAFWALRLCGAADLAVVRPFSSDDEIQRMEEVFGLWNQLQPCLDRPKVPIDLFLVYSKNFTENPPAGLATENIAALFENATTQWRKCFRSLYIHEANLTATEDVYDARGYTVRKDWVNGPNQVFRFILQRFLDGSFGTYDAFYFMEFDAAPVRSFWLEQFVQEALYYPSAAVRGSHYRGDSWDPFLRQLPQDLLAHINGNAIYNLTHPFLQLLFDRLVESDVSEVAFDVLLARLTLEHWNATGLSEDMPYLGDSTLVGNYARTLLNSSFESLEFVRHGSGSNLLQNIDEGELTLGVLAAHADIEVFTSTVNSNHPFRKIIILEADVAANVTAYEVMTPRGPTSVKRIVQQNDTVAALCELASHVTTKYLAFTDTHHTLASPVHILADASGAPVLPYVPMELRFCRDSAVCTSQVEEASQLFGVDLSYHQDTYETVFYTDLFRSFCDAWQVAVAELGTYESCGHVHGPTADGYIAWMISVNAEFKYLPRNKAQVGWRSWGCLWDPHPPDLRDCAVYGQEEFELMTGNITRCCQIIDDPTGCQAQPECSWRPIFETGKCHPTPEVDYIWRSPRSWTTQSQTATRTTSTPTSTRTMSTQTFTATSTATSTLLTSTATTTPSAAELTGCWGLSVTDTTRLVDSPEFREVLRKVLARAAGPSVQPDYVHQLELFPGQICGSGRRLHDRKLQESFENLRVDYIIVFPAALGVGTAVALAESSKRGLETLSVEESTTWMQEEIAQVALLSDLQVQVTTKSVVLTVSGDFKPTQPAESGSDSTAVVIALSSVAVLTPLCLTLLWWRCGKRLTRANLPDSKDVKVEVEQNASNEDPVLLDEKDFRRILTTHFQQGPANAGEQEGEELAEEQAPARRKRKKKVRRLVPKDRVKNEPNSSPDNAVATDVAEAGPKKAKKKVLRKRLVPKQRSCGTEDLDQIQLDVAEGATTLEPSFPWEDHIRIEPDLPWEDYNGLAQSVANANVEYDPHETW